MILPAVFRVKRKEKAPFASVSDVSTLNRFIKFKLKSKPANANKGQFENADSSSDIVQEETRDVEYQVLVAADRETESYPSTDLDIDVPFYGNNAFNSHSLKQIEKFDDYENSETDQWSLNECGVTRSLQISNHCHTKIPSSANSGNTGNQDMFNAISNRSSVQIQSSFTQHWPDSVKTASAESTISRKRRAENETSLDSSIELEPPIEPKRNMECARILANQDVNYSLLKLQQEFIERDGCSSDSVILGSLPVLQFTPDAALLVASENSLKHALQMATDDLTYLVAGSIGILSVPGYVGYAVQCCQPAHESNEYVERKFTFALFITAIDDQWQIKGLFDRCFQLLKELNGGAPVRFKFAISDSVVRDFVQSHLNGMKTSEMLKVTSDMLCNQLPLADCLRLIPIYACLVYEMKNETEFLYACPEISMQAKKLFLKLRLKMLQLNDVDQARLFCERVLALISRKYWTSEAQKAAEQVSSK